VGCISDALSLVPSVVWCIGDAPYNAAMSLVPDRAICVRIYPYSETSQIATIFGRTRGLVRVIAKGSHRTTKAGSSKFDGGLDLLDEADALVGDRTEKDLNILGEWKIVEGFRDLRRSSRAMLLGLMLAEQVGELFAVNDPHTAIYDRLRHTLGQLGGVSVEESAVAMLLDVLRASGYLPSLTKCASCGNPVAGERVLYFSPQAGGVVCRNCEAALADRMNVDARLIGIAVNVLRLPREKNGAALRLPRLTRAQSDPLLSLLLLHVQHVIQKPLRMKRWVESPTRRGNTSGGRTAQRVREVSVTEPQTPAGASGEPDAPAESISN
jgi:DNA repair protein RecO